MAPQTLPSRNTLTEEYRPTQPLKQKTAKKRKSRQDDESDDHFIDTKASRKILKLGGDLEEEEAEDIRAKREDNSNGPFGVFDSPFVVEEEEQDYGEHEEEAWENEEEEIVELDDANPEDLALFNRFNPDAMDQNIRILEDGIRGDGTTSAPAGETRNLADIILTKIAEHEAAQSGKKVEFEDPDEREQEPVELPEKVQEVYTKIGHILSRYKSGPLPKPFKIIPTLPIPMQHTVIPLTRPESWTPNAIYEATRVFISGAPSTAQGFLSNVLLDRVREDIHDTHQLNVHLYKSLKKSLYKPAAFFKGILFPLLTSACTLREATIVSSVMAKVSIPVLHSAAALSRCCDIAAEQMAYDPNSAGPTNLCIKVLLDKRYALPYQTIDSLVFHFLRFRPTEDSGDADMNGNGNTYSKGKLPVIWHQCLLVFAQRYRDEISEEQREALLDLLLVRAHRDIAPEIRRELLQGRGRGTVPEPQDGAARDGGDDTLMAM